MKKIIALILVLMMFTCTATGCIITELFKKSDKDTIEVPVENETEKDEDKNSINNGHNSNENANSGSDSDATNTPYVPKTESSMGLKFTLDADGKGYALTGIGTCTEANIVIDGHNGLPVTSVSFSGDSNYENVTSIVLGDSVIEIPGYNAFTCFSNLKGCLAHLLYHYFNNL